MRKIVINRCYGGFSLSHKAVMRYAELKGEEIYGYVEARKADGSYDFNNYELYSETEAVPFCIHYITKKFKSPTVEQLNANHSEIGARLESRDDPLLIQTVEELEEEANGSHAKLKIVEIPDDVKWFIDEYDGIESVEEEHRSWG